MGFDINLIGGFAILSRFALRALLTLDTLGFDAGIHAVDGPIAVLADGNNRGMPVLAGLALGTLFALGTVGDGEGGGGVITISDGVSVYQTIRGGLDDGDDGDAVLTGFALVAFGTLGLNPSIDVINKPIAIGSDLDNRGVAVGTRLALDALDALLALLALLTLGTVGHGEVGSMTVGIGNGIGID